MLMIVSLMFISLIIVLLLVLLCNMCSKKTKMDREKMSPFECGFDPISSPRLPFTIQFFLIAILFLIFDVEIVIIMPMIITFKITNFISWFYLTSMFIITLLIGLYYEWYNNMLKWSS